MDSFVWHKMPIQVVHFFAQCSILIVGLDFRVRLYDREPPEGKNKKMENRSDYSGSGAQLRVFKQCVTKTK